MSRCQFCRSGGDCFEWCGVEPQTLYDELQTVKDQLREAVEIVKHLANSTHPYAVHEHRETLEHRFGLQIEAAREFLTKHQLNSEEGR